MKIITGRGIPRANTKGALRQKYRDTETDHVWRMTEAGWAKCSSLTFAPLPSEKGRMILAARHAGQTLEDWTLEKLLANAPEVKAPAKYDH